ncbi:MAG TPA: glycosyltransferase [Chitinophagaceae bacterium]|nr:glycosyltransferase [Chitinophagaceae bacterium]
MFSILIPTWNNLPYLKACLESIRLHSSFDHQIVLHVNEGNDGTLEWVRSQGIEHSFTPDNAGICIGMNLAAARAKHPLLLYLNDDMYCCPGWDRYLMEAADRIPTNAFLLSSTLIEPRPTRNSCVIVRDYGQDLEGFRKEELLSGFSGLRKADWSGSTWPPTLMHRQYWDRIGGYSIEFSPGMSSDDDLSMKMWMAGCRIFRGIGESRVYHFQCKSTGRVQPNDGRRQFLMKWGLNQSGFRRVYLKMGRADPGPLADPFGTRAYRWEKFRAGMKRRFL